MNNKIDKLTEIRHKIFKKFIGNVRGKTILDVSGSTGEFLEVLEANKNTSHILDISKTYLKVASKRGFKTHFGNAEKIKLKQKFDIVIAFDILEHISNPDKLLSNIKNFLKSNGKLFIATPYKEDLTPYEKIKDIYEFSHLRTFDEDSLSNLLTKMAIK